MLRAPSEDWCAVQGLNLQKAPDLLVNSHSASQIASQEISEDIHGLDSVVVAWPKLPPALKAAIIAIVDSSSASSFKEFPSDALPVVRNSLNPAELKG